MKQSLEDKVREVLDSARTDYDDGKGKRAVFVLNKLFVDLDQALAAEAPSAVEAEPQG